MTAGAALSDIAEALSRFTAPSWRMEMLDLGSDRTLIRDCYNANPQSMQAALEVLVERQNGPSLAVIANMQELGSNSEALHEDLGKQAANLGISRIVFVGGFGTFFERGFVSAGGNARNIIVSPNKKAAWEAIKPELKKFTTILVKGSRRMEMETLAEQILEEN